MNYIKKLAEHLKAVDKVIFEKDLVIILISNLPEEYNYLITSLETIAEVELTWDYVRDRLIHEYDTIYGESGSDTIVKTEKAKACQDALLSKKHAEQKKSNNGIRFLCHRPEL